MRRLGAATAALALLVAGASGAATLRGTSGNDRLAGTSKADRMHGLRGKDRLSGHGGGDTIRGGRGRDMLIGKRGHDLLLGGPRSDRLNGGTGDDDLVGATGADRLRDGPGIDVVDAGRGDDVILSRNGSEDQIDCGPGVDTAVLDETEDGVFDCEELQLPPEPQPSAATAATRFWLGEEFEGLPLTHADGGLFIYGDCDPGPEGGCAPPLEVQNRTSCERNPVGIDVPPRSVFRLRGGGIVSEYSDGFDVLAGHTGLTVFANSRARARRALSALRPRGASAPVRLEKPRLPFAVLLELKRVRAAQAGYRSVGQVSRLTGVARWRVRTWLGVAKLLGAKTLRDVRKPRLSWRTVRQYRQVGFMASEFGVRRAAKQFDLSRAEVRRRARRVRGLIGSASGPASCRD